VLAAVFASAATPANAQVTSEQRIPVRKQSGGDLARADSIAEAARRDSIAMLQARNDSIARANQAYRDSVDRAVAAYRDSVNAVAAAERARADSIARADSVRHSAALAAAATAAIPVALSRRGFYFGLAGGTSSPVDDWEGPYSTGFNITAPFGWQPFDSRFGVRGDIAYDLHGGEFFPAGSPIQPIDYPQPVFTTNDALLHDVSIWSLNLDATFDVFQWGDRRLGNLYVLGGIGVSYVNSPKANVYAPGTGQVTQVIEGDSKTAFGFNGGAGLSFGIGRQSLFLETRWFTADVSPTNASWVPLILGIKFY
jgi:hypothetical protein